MIKRKSAREIEFMRQAGKIAAAARLYAGKLVTAGVTTQSINNKVHNFIISRGAVPAFLGYRDYPASICVAVNEEVIHGLPSARKLVNGDIVGIDIGVKKNGYVGDCAATFVVGSVCERTTTLIETAKQCFFEGLKFAKVGYRISDISRGIQQYAEKNGFSVVHEYVGHGVGKTVHEDPEVPNFVEFPRTKPDVRLLPGMTLALEPMVNLGTGDVKVAQDGWTIITADSLLSAHYENTILITKGEPEILTACEGEL